MDACNVTLPSPTHTHTIWLFAPQLNFPLACMRRGYVINSKEFPICICRYGERCMCRLWRWNKKKNHQNKHAKKNMLWATISVAMKRKRTLYNWMPLPIQSAEKLRAQLIKRIIPAWITWTACWLDKSSPTSPPALSVIGDVELIDQLVHGAWKKIKSRKG